MSYTSKAVAVVAGVTAAISLAIAYPVARLTEPVKTKVEKQQVVLKNGVSTVEMTKSFGKPASVISSPTQVTLPTGCAVYGGKTDASGNPKWIVVACALSR